MLASTYQSTDSPLLSTLYEPLPKHLISVLELLPPNGAQRGAVLALLVIRGGVLYL